MVNGDSQIRDLFSWKWNCRVGSENSRDFSANQKVSLCEDKTCESNNEKEAMAGFKGQDGDEWWWMWNSLPVSHGWTFWKNGNGNGVPPLIKWHGFQLWMGTSWMSAEDLMIHAEVPLGGPAVRARALLRTAFLGRAGLWRSFFQRWSWKNQSHVYLSQGDLPTVWTTSHFFRWLTGEIFMWLIDLYRTWWFSIVMLNS